jgi:D-3-phosphoglycerate dehydrogenase
VDLFRARGHQVDLLKTMPESELIKVIGEYDGMVVRSATKVKKSEWFCILLTGLND